MSEIRTYSKLPVSTKRTLRFAGVADADDALTSLCESCIDEARDAIKGRVCYAVYALSEGDVDTERGEVRLPFATLRSHALARLIEPYGEAVVFAATVGVGIDRLIARYGVSSPSRAVLLDAFGYEQVERLCDEFCGEMSDGYETSTRFSPGYSDLSLEVQRDIFAALDCPRTIGLSLTESLLMTPGKSVSAIFGRTRKTE